MDRLVLVRPNESLPHKVPFKPDLEEEGPLVVTSNLAFDLEILLKASCSAFSPPPSPTLTPLDSLNLDHPNGLFDLPLLHAAEGGADIDFSHPAVLSPFHPSRPFSPSDIPDDTHLFDSLFSLSDLSSDDEEVSDSLGICQRSSPALMRPPSPMTLVEPTLQNAALRAPQSSERKNPRGEGAGISFIGLDNPALVETSATSQPTRKQRRRAQNHKNRKKCRQDAREQVFSHYQSRFALPGARIASDSVIRTVNDTESGSAAAGAFVGLNDGSGQKKLYQLSYFVGKGSKQFDYVGWDGKTRRSVADAKGRKIVLLAGQPRGEDWPLLMEQAAEALESKHSRLTIQKGERVDRRGAFPAIRCGVSHGGGSTCPGNLKNEDENAKVVGELVEMECFKRLAGFASSVMSWQALKIFAYYLEHLAKLHEKHPHLKRLFPSSIFAAASFNFGPSTACFKHKDFANLPFGLCAVTALGSFDPRKGGHLILWELKLVVEFPAGSTILLPSAIIAHSNIPVQKDEHRYSFAQYTAGGIFRWVENEYMLTKDYYATLSLEDLEEEEKKNAERWQLGLSLFEQAF